VAINSRLSKEGFISGVSVSRTHLGSVLAMALLQIFEISMLLSVNPWQASTLALISLQSINHNLEAQISHF